MVLRNQFRQATGWPVIRSVPTRFLAPIYCSKISAQGTVGAWRNYYYSSEKRYNIFEYETKSAVEIDRVATLEEDGAFRIYRVRAASYGFGDSILKRQFYSLFLA